MYQLNTVLDLLGCVDLMEFYCEFLSQFFLMKWFQLLDIDVFEYNVAMCCLILSHKIKVQMNFILLDSRVAFCDLFLVW